MTTLLFNISDILSVADISDPVVTQDIRGPGELLASPAAHYVSIPVILMTPPEVPVVCNATWYNAGVIFAAEEKYDSGS